MKTHLFLILVLLSANLFAMDEFAVSLNENRKQLSKWAIENQDPIATSIAGGSVAAYFYTKEKKYLATAAGAIATNAIISKYSSSKSESPYLFAIDEFKHLKQNIQNFPDWFVENKTPIIITSSMVGGCASLYFYTGQTKYLIGTMAAGAIGYTLLSKQKSEFQIKFEELSKEYEDACKKSNEAQETYEISNQNRKTSNQSVLNSLNEFCNIGSPFKQAPSQDQKKFEALLANVVQESDELNEESETSLEENEACKKRSLEFEQDAAHLANSNIRLTQALTSTNQKAKDVTSAYTEHVTKILEELKI